MTQQNSKRATIALIFGSGSNAPNEACCIDTSKFDILAAVNQAAIDFSPVDVHLSLHPKVYGPKKVGHFVSPIPTPDVDEVYTKHWGNSLSSGSSGMYAVHYLLEKRDVDLVLLCGIGIDATPHYYGGGDWRDAIRFQKTWEQMAPLMRGRVFSLGGWTKQLLNPTGEMPKQLREAIHHGTTI